MASSGFGFRLCVENISDRMQDCGVWKFTKGLGSSVAQKISNCQDFNVKSEPSKLSEIDLKSSVGVCHVQSCSNVFPFWRDMSNPRTTLLFSIHWTDD